MNTILATKEYVDALSQNKFSVFGFNDDSDSAPEQVSNSDGIPAASFKPGVDKVLLFETDWAQRNDIPISIEYYMDKSDAGKQIYLQIGYSFDGASMSWLDAETVTAPSDMSMKQYCFSAVIPSTVIPSGESHTLRIKLRRLGSNEQDTHTGNFCLAAVKYYRIGD